MDFEWDEKKRRQTLQERGLDFRGRPPPVRWAADLQLSVATRRRGSGRQRWSYRSRPVAVVWVERNGICRIISIGEQGMRRKRSFVRYTADELSKLNTETD